MVGEFMMVNKNIDVYIHLEEITALIFEKCNYVIKKTLSNEHGLMSWIPDVIAEKGDDKLYIEVKSKIDIKNFERLKGKWCDIAQNNNARPVLVVFSKVHDKVKKNNGGIVVIDICELLDIIEYDSNFKIEFTKLISYNLDDVEPIKNSLGIKIPKNELNPNDYINKIQQCSTGNECSVAYEKICVDVLSYLFSNELTLWKQQLKSNNMLFRFDLICRIKSGINSDFWSIIERHYNTCYIIFEFKNYTDEVTQKEIYTTSRYLYAKSLRNVGIMIAPKGYDAHAEWAARGCLREDGKLLLLLTNDDLIEMIKLRENGGDPAGLLLDKLDNMLLILEK